MSLKVETMTSHPTADRVSVIIPTYNRAEKCLRAVESVLAQSHQSVEVIVVDDGSTDDTESTLSGRDDRVRYVRQENSGVAAARNRGFREATGNYVAFLDSDDVWNPRKLELQLHVLEHFSDVGMVWTEMDAVDESGRLVSPRYLRKMYSAYADFSFDSAWDESVTLGDVWPGVPSEWAEVGVHCGDIYSSMFMGNLVHTSTVVLRKTTREAVGEFDETLVKTGEDYDYHFRTCAEGRVALLDLPLVRYQVGGADQLTSPELSDLIARNNLRTMQKAWSAHRDRIDLPRPMVKRRWASAHLWLGYSLLWSDPAASRRNLVASLRHRPVQPTTIGLVLLTLVPRPVLGFLRAVRESLRRRAA